MAFDCAARLRVRLLVVSRTTEEPVSNHISRAVWSPPQLIGTIITVLLVALRLNICIRVPVGPELQGVFCDYAREVVVNGGIALERSEGFPIAKTGRKRDCRELRKCSTPGGQEVRDLGSCMSEQTIHIEAECISVNCLRIT